MHKRFIALLLTLVLLSLLPLAAEELWVRNRPFKGQVEGKGASLKVDLDALLKALELKANIQGNDVIFGDFKVPIETNSAGTRMVLLRDNISGPGIDDISRQQYIQKHYAHFIAKLGQSHG